MDLAAHQRKLLGLFRSTYQVCGDDEAYIHKVAQSRDLEEGRRNIFLLASLGARKDRCAHV